MSIFAQKHQKFENSAISNQTTPETSPPSTAGPTSDAKRVYTSPPTPNDLVLQSPTSTTTASSSESLPTPVTPHPSRHKKSAPLRAVSKSQLLIDSPASTTVVVDLKTRPEMARFIKNHQKLEFSRIFAQTPIVSGDLKSEDDVYSSLAPSNIVTTLETRSETADFMENHQNVEFSRIFAQIPLVSGDLKSEDNVYLSSAPTTIVTAFETHSALTGFTKKHRKVENSLIFNQNHSSPSPNHSKMDHFTNTNTSNCYNIISDNPSSGKDPPRFSILLFTYHLQIS
jgi:hypothetical protein